MRIIKPPILNALACDSPLSQIYSINNLADSVTINSQTKTPNFLIRGSDAVQGQTWKARYGGDLAITLSGIAPTVGNDTPFKEKSVWINTSSYYSNQTGMSSAIGTDDFLLEAVLSGTSHASSHIFLLASVNYWFSIYGTPTTIGLYKYVSAAVNVQTALQAGVYTHLLFAVDRNNSAGVLMYVNGKYVTGADWSSDAATNFEGRILRFYESTNSNILHVGLWTGASWFAAGATHRTQLDAFASDRYAQLSKTKAVASSGTSTPTFTRNLQAAIRTTKANRPIMYQAHTNHIRKEDRGFLIEPSITNSNYDSNAINRWQKTGSPTGIVENTGPDGVGTCTKVSGTPNSSACWYTVGAASHAASAPVGIGLWFRKTPGDTGFVGFGTTSHGGSPTGYWALHLDKISNEWTWVDRATISAIGAVATEWKASSSGQAGFIFYGDYVNNVSKTYWVSQLQLQTTDSYYCTSPIYTLGGVATRPADVLYYTANDGNFNLTQGTVEFDFHVLREPLVEDGLLACSASSSRNNAIEVLMTTAGYIKVVSTVGGVANTTLLGNVNRADNQRHHCKLAWLNNNMIVTVDNNVVGTSSNLTVPANIDKIYCGALGDGTVPSSKWFQNLKIYDYPR